VPVAPRAPGGTGKDRERGLGGACRARRRQAQGWVRQGRRTGQVTGGTAVGLALELVPHRMDTGQRLADQQDQHQPEQQAPSGSAAASIRVLSAFCHSALCGCADRLALPRGVAHGVAQGVARVDHN